MLSILKFSVKILLVAGAVAVKLTTGLSTGFGDLGGASEVCLRVCAVDR